MHWKLIDSNYAGVTFSITQGVVHTIWTISRGRYLQSAFHRRMVWAGKWVHINVNDIFQYPTWALENRGRNKMLHRSVKKLIFFKKYI